MLYIFSLIVAMFFVFITLIQLLFYAFRWYEISNRVFDPQVTWFKALTWRKWRPLRTFANEIFYSALYNITIVLGLLIKLFKENLNSIDPAKFVRDKPVIILIHGYMGQPIHFWLMRLRLTFKKTPNVVTFGYKLGGNEIEPYRSRLREFVLQIHAETGIRDIIFIGQSFGGVMALDYAHEYEGSGEVMGVIALGSPFRGSRLSVMAITPLARSLHPESPLLAKVIDIKIKAPFITIYSRYEQLVLPYTNAQHPYADENIEVDTCGHSGYFLNGKVFKIVYEKLSSFY